MIVHNVRNFGEIYTKDEIVKVLVKLNDVISYINMVVSLYEQNRCMDCGYPIETKNYINKCSHNPKEHCLGDADTCIKKIRKELETDALYSPRK